MSWKCYRRTPDIDAAEGPGVRCNCPLSDSEWRPWSEIQCYQRVMRQFASPVHEIADGDVVLWSVDGTVHIKTTDKHNDPVELNEHQALELSDLLTQLVKDG